MPSANVLVLSPALPSELLTYILDYHVYPTTLIICSSRAEFLESLTNEAAQNPHSAPNREITADEDTNDHNDPPPEPRSQPEQQQQQPPPAPRPPPPQPNIKLLSSPLYQLSISRHIRIIYTPTVTHLRSYLAVFSPNSPPHTITPPPSSFRSPSARKPPHLILYGLVALHRETSEWSAQGLGTTCAAVAETGRRFGWRVEVADPPSPSPPSSRHASSQDHDDHHEPLYGYDDHDDGSRHRIIRRDEGLQMLLKEKLPILSGGIARRPDADEGGRFSGRAVEVGRVLSRWCDFGTGQWDEQFEDQGA
ncbi:hypothetical protein PGQ11_007515 [Apiospora arundinis]|uniref:Uncharacterized protein n=1 Tax=Apiospora arundinis TaxID=335852 RepID=A0ABR2IVR5_9PEZI